MKSNLTVYLVILLLSGIYSVIHGNLPQSYRLMDGTQATLVGWTYGKRHPMMSQSVKWWKKFFPSHAPVTMFLETPEDQLILWLSAKGKPETFQYVRPYSNQHITIPKLLWDRVEIADDFGHRSAMKPDNTVFFNSQGMHRGELSLNLTEFPRRGKHIYIRLFAKQQTRPFAEYVVPNPTQGSFPTWKPESLPITKRDGDLAFTLTSIAQGDYMQRLLPWQSMTAIPIRSAVPPLASEDEPLNCMRFDVSDKGKPTQLWEPQRAVFFDATGNSRHVDMLSLRSQFPLRIPTPPKSFCFWQLPVFGEHATRVHMTFEQSRDSSFMPSELWQVRNLDVPSPKTILSSNIILKRDGMTLQLLGLILTTRFGFCVKFRESCPLVRVHEC